MLRDLFSIHVPVLEIVLRGTLVYWLLFSIFRFVLRRDVGAVGIAVAQCFLAVQTPNMASLLKDEPLPPFRGQAVAVRS